MTEGKKVRELDWVKMGMSLVVPKPDELPLARAAKMRENFLVSVEQGIPSTPLYLYK